MDDLLTQRATFEEDNFDSRRTTGHNLFDPESLLTGEEVKAGFAYDNSHREYTSEFQRDQIVRGVIPATEVPKVAPRVFNKRAVSQSAD